MNRDKHPRLRTKIKNVELKKKKLTKSEKTAPIDMLRTMSSSSSVSDDNPINGKKLEVQ